MPHFLKNFLCSHWSSILDWFGIATPTVTSSLPKYLYYPVFGQQACPLGWRVLVHCPDVLSRPRPLAVQIKAKSIGPSLDDAKTRPQLRTLLLKQNRGVLMHDVTRIDTLEISKNTSTIWSERTRGTKIMESSCEWLTMNINPRLNIQVTAACWSIKVFNSQDKSKTHLDSTWVSGRKRVLEERGSMWLEVYREGPRRLYGEGYRGK